MKILVTGGSGFLGRNLIERLVRDGHTISCLDRYEAPFIGELGVTMFKGAIYEKLLVDEAVQGQDAVIHMACTVLPKTSNDDPHFDVMSNIGGAIYLLEAAARHGAGKFVFISSGGTVYGKPQQVPIKESDPTNPECSYGITKLAIEKYLRLYHDQKGLATCSLRLANPYGRYQRYKAVQGAIPVFAYKLLRNEPIEIWGDGTVRRDFVYIDDVVEAIVKAVHSPNAVGELNIGGGCATSLNELLDMLEECVGYKARREYRASRWFDVPVNMLDISRARNALGWEPQISMRDGLRRTIDWIRSELPSAS